MDIKHFKPNDRVNWHYTPRGGYGFSVAVAGIVIRATAKRITIKVARKVDDIWQNEQRTVSADKVTPRITLCAELDEIS